MKFCQSTEVRGAAFVAVLDGAACAGEEGEVEADGDALAHATMAEPTSKSNKNFEIREKRFRYICGSKVFLVYSISQRRKLAEV